MKKILSVVLIIMIIQIGYFTFGLSVYADDLIQPYPYSIEVDDGNKVFLMFPSNDHDHKSGLYYNTDPLVNIYFINDNQYFYEHNLVFSQDGLTFAHLPWTSASDEVAIEFYHNGIVGKVYTINDLVINRTALNYSVSHITWEKTKERNYDSILNRLTIVTKDNNIIQFDFASGNILNRKISFLWFAINIYLYYGLLIIFIIATVIVTVLVIKKRKIAKTI